MKRLIKSIAVASSVVLTACSGTPAKLGSTTAEAPKNVDFSKGHAVNGRDCGFQLLTFIPIAINNRLQRANEDLIEQAHGDYITDVKITESWKYAFVGTVYCTELSAMAYPQK